MWAWLKSLFVKPKPNEPIELVVADTSNWRKGMWVVYAGDVGVLYDITPAYAEVHLVDVATGLTIKEVRPAISALRQAKWLEIPDCRRGIEREAGRELGYGD